MKKIIWYILFLALLVATIVLCVLRYQDNATVTYTGDGNTISAEELFPEDVFLMPGDSVSTVITLKNSTPKADINLYIRAQGEDNVSTAYLQELNFTITPVDTADSSAKTTLGLNDWIHLGQLAPGQTKAMEVTLHAPITMEDWGWDSDVTLQWEYMAEEVHTPDASVKRDFGWLMTLCMILAFVLLALVVLWKKKPSPVTTK